MVTDGTGTNFVQTPQGYVVDPWHGNTFNLRAPPGQCVVREEFGCSRGDCSDCRLYRRMTTNMDSLYYQFK